MKFNNHLQQCKDNDILCYGQEQLVKIKKFKDVIINTLRVQIPYKLKEALEKEKLYISPSRKNGEGRRATYQEYPNAWFEEGVEFQILRAGSEGWQKGKMKINVILEFCPDEPEEDKSESPLDDIRKTINQ